MSLRTFANSLLFAAVTALCMLGSLTVPVPAQARPMVPLAPACTQYQFAGKFSLRQDNGFKVSFTSTGSTAGGRATAVGDSGYTMKGNVTGGINGRNVDFTIFFDNSSDTGHYLGVVGDDGFVRGGSTLNQANANSAYWNSTSALACITPTAPAPPVQDDPKPAAAKLGAIATGPATLQVGLSGTYVVTVSNEGGLPSAPVDLVILFAGKLEQTGQIVAGGGVCELRPPDAGINAAVRCTRPQLEPGARYDIVVQGRGSTSGPGKLLAKIGNDINQKDVAIT